MSIDVKIAIINGAFSIGGIIVGWLFTIYRHDIEKLFRRTGNSDLIGRWRCVWREQDDAAEKRTLEDIVEITKVTRKNIYGRSDGPISADTDYGSYKLKGMNSPYSICFSYHGEGRAKNLFGVTLLQRGPTPDTLTGQWCQLTKDNVILGGATEWTKVIR